MTQTIQNNAPIAQQAPTLANPPTITQRVSAAARSVIRAIGDFFQNIALNVMVFQSKAYFAFKAYDDRLSGTLYHLRSGDGRITRTFQQQIPYIFNHATRIEPHLLAQNRLLEGMSLQEQYQTLTRGARLLDILAHSHNQLRRQLRDFRYCNKDILALTRTPQFDIFCLRLAEVLDVDWNKHRSHLSSLDTLIRCLIDIRPEDRNEKLRFINENLYHLNLSNISQHFVSKTVEGLRNLDQMTHQLFSMSDNINYHTAFNILADLPQNDAETIMDQMRQLQDEYFVLTREQRMEYFRNFVLNRTNGERLAYVLERGDPLAPPLDIRDWHRPYINHWNFIPAMNPAAGLNVHNGTRDNKTLDGILKLEAHIGALTPAQIEDAYKDCIKYIQTNTKITAEQRALALNALYGPKNREDNFGPLVSHDSFTLLGHNINGKRLIAQLWIFANQIKDDKDKENARFAIFSALKNSYSENGKRVCNQGKIQRLIVGVLPGRLRGVNVESHDVGIAPPTLAEAQRIFFTEERQRITSFRILMEQAEIFLRENPLVDRKAFLDALNDENFKTLQGFTE